MTHLNIFLLIADNSDVETLRALPEFEILQKAKQYGINSEQLSPRERQIARTILNLILDHLLMEQVHIML